MSTEATARPSAFIQWKGTSACLDLHCACGQDLHFDGEFAYELTCGVCGRAWELPTVLVLKEATDPVHNPIVLYPTTW